MLRNKGRSARRVRACYLVQECAHVIVSLSASPFTAGKHARREEMLGSMALKHSVPVAYVNQYGGNDDLVFDGRSSALVRRLTCLVH